MAKTKHIAIGNITIRYSYIVEFVLDLIYTTPFSDTVVWLLIIVYVYVLFAEMIMELDNSRKIFPLV